MAPLPSGNSFLAGLPICGSRFCRKASASPLDMPSTKESTPPRPNPPALAPSPLPPVPRHACARSQPRWPATRRPWRRREIPEPGISSPGRRNDQPMPGCRSPRRPERPRADRSKGWTRTGRIRPRTRRGMDFSAVAIRLRAPTAGSPLALRREPPAKIARATRVQDAPPMSSIRATVRATVKGRLRHDHPQAQP